MCTVISTNTTAAEDRASVWRQTILEVLGADVQLVLNDRELLSASASVHAFGAVQLLQMEVGTFSMRWSMAENAAELLVIVPLEGVCLLRQANTETLLDAHSFFVMSTSVDSEFEFVRPFRFVALALRKDRLPAIRRTLVESSALRIPIRSDSSTLFASFLAALARNHDDLTARNSAKVIDTVLDLLDDALRQHCGARSRSNREWHHRERITAVVERELRNPALDISYISRSVGLSPRHVHRLFADDPVPLMQWVLELRLENCYRELVHEGPCGRTIGEIAYSWGFNDQAHFSRAFRKHFGITPSAVRFASNSANAA